MAFAYVPNSVSNNVSVIDTTTNTVVATIPVGQTPFGVAVDSQTVLTFVYITNAGPTSNSVSVIDVNTNTVIATIPVGTRPVGVAVTPDKSFVYVANLDSNDVSVIDTSSNTVIATIPVAIQPHGIVVTPNGDFVYVVSTSGNTISVIDTATNTVVATIPVNRPYNIAITPDGLFAYATEADVPSNVYVIDTTTNTLVATIATAGGQPHGLIVTLDGSFVYVGGNASGNTYVIDTTTNTVVDTIVLGGAPNGLSVTPDNLFVYISNTLLNQVNVIDISTNTVVATVPVGIFPFSEGVFIGELLVCPTITLSPSTGPTTPLPSGQLAVFYNQSVIASGGTAPYSYAVSAGSLPPGLVLFPTSGVIAGIPSVPGIFIFTITATDANGCTGDQEYSITVPPFVGGSSVSKSFSASSVSVGTSSTLTITIVNSGSTTITGIGFNDIFPVGLEVAPIPNLTNNMGGIFIPIPSSGDTSLNFSGGTLLAGQIGIITIDVISNTEGTYVNDTGLVISDVGVLGSATGTLEVTSTPPIPPKKKKKRGVFSLPFSICTNKMCYDQYNRVVPCDGNNKNFVSCPERYPQGNGMIYVKVYENETQCCYQLRKL